MIFYKGLILYRGRPYYVPSACINYDTLVMGMDGHIENSNWLMYACKYGWVCTEAVLGRNTRIHPEVLVYSSLRVCLPKSRSGGSVSACA